MCSCGEAKFVRTEKVFRKGDVHELFLPHLLARVGKVCETPPVHNCSYVHLRNQLCNEADRQAHAEMAGIKDSVAHRTAVDRERAAILRQLMEDSANR